MLLALRQADLAWGVQALTAGENMSGGESVRRVLPDDGDAVAEVGHEGAVALLRAMVRIRRIDERMMSLQRQGEIGFHGPAIGQEAVAVGVSDVLQPRDLVFPALRENAIMLLRGFDLAAWMAQWFGNELDVARGRQMPCHPSSRAVGQVSWSTCVGTQLPHAVGAAWAMRYRGEDAVSIGFTGDGATSHQDFHAAMNLASAWRAPCVIVCQNNHWAISTPSSRQSGAATIADRARAYGMPSERVDGNDVLAVREGMGEAVARARAGRGPTFVECVTYRQGPHTTSDDPRLYRTEQEEQSWLRRDPIRRMRRWLERTGRIEPGDVASWDEQTDAEFSAALETVRGGGLPPVESLFEDVYARVPRHLEEQRAELLRAKR